MHKRKYRIVEGVVYKKIYSQNEMAKILGVNVRTIGRWHDSGKLVANKLPSGRKYYTQGQVDEIVNKTQ